MGSDVSTSLDRSVDPIPCWHDLADGRDASPRLEEQEKSAPRDPKRSLTWHIWTPGSSNDRFPSSLRLVTKHLGNGMVNLKAGIVPASEPAVSVCPRAEAGTHRGEKCLNGISARC